MATTFSNVATLSYNGAQVRSNIAVGSIEGILSVSKNAVSSEYAEGDVLTYVVSIVNNSAEAITGLTVSDDLGAYPFGTGTVQPLTYVPGTIQYYQNGVLQPDPAVSTASGLSISNITVPANGNTTIVYSAAVNSYAPPTAGSAITNTVTVDSAAVNAATAEETVSPVSAPTLSVIKSVTPVPVAENGELSYTFRLLNSGNTAVTADENAAVSDTFSPVLTDISVTLDGAPLTPVTDYTYDEATGVFETVDGVIAIPAATYTQNPATGEWSTAPGTVTMTVTGRISPMS